MSGHFSKNFTVHTNDPVHPRVTLSVTGTILGFVTVAPSSRIYLRGMYGERVEKEITVTSGEMARDFRILGLTSNIDDKMTYRLIEDAPGTYRVKIMKNPKLPTLNTWGSLKIHTNSEKAPEKVVQVNVTTRGSIVVQPTTINFGSVSEAGADVAKTITIFKVNGDFNIRDIEFSSDLYHADFEPIEDGKKYKVTVSFRPGMESKSYLDEMIINTDDPSEPSVRVKLLARRL